MTWPDEVAAALPDSSVRAAPGESPRAEMPTEAWHDQVRAARDDLGCDFFDFLTVAEEPRGGFRVVCHLARLGEPGVRGVLLEAVLDESDASIASVADLFAGASWHEREMHEMYGVAFDGGDPRPLLLDGETDQPPLRKDVLLPARSARPWPGAKEPGESDADASPSRRRLRPPGVPEEGRS